MGFEVECAQTRVTVRLLFCSFDKILRIMYSNNSRIFRSLTRNTIERKIRAPLTPDLGRVFDTSH